MMKTLWMTAVLAGLVTAVTVQAEEAAVAASPAPAPAPEVKKLVKKEMPPAQDLELIGQVIRQEKVGRDKTGAEIKKTLVMLDVAADGVRIPLPANKKDGIDPAAFVGKTVKVSGKGYSMVSKKGKKHTRLVKLVKIEEVAVP